MQWFDTHAHLDADAFDGDRDAVTLRARDAGVAVVTVGIDAVSSRSAVEIARKNEWIWAAVGIQPNSLERLDEAAAEANWLEIEMLARKAESNRIVAIGETGLDDYWKSVPLDRQRMYLRRHLEMAAEMSLPVILHARSAEALVADELEQFARERPISGVMHSYTGDWSTAERCLGLGLYISFAGMVTYKKNQDLVEIARRVPRDRLLLETDAPYLAPQGLRGKRNEPSFLPRTGEQLAEMLGMSVVELAELTTANANRLYPTRSRSAVQKTGEERPH